MQKLSDQRYCRYQHAPLALRRPLQFRLPTHPTTFIYLTALYCLLLPSTSLSLSLSLLYSALVKQWEESCVPVMQRQPPARLFFSRTYGYPQAVSSVLAYVR